MNLNRRTFCASIAALILPISIPKLPVKVREGGNLQIYGINKEFTIEWIEVSEIKDDYSVVLAGQPEKYTMYVVPSVHLKQPMKKHMWNAEAMQLIKDTRIRHTKVFYNIGGHNIAIISFETPYTVNLQAIKIARVDFQVMPYQE